MGLTAKGSDTDFTPVKAGTHTARCIQAVDLGTQFSDYYGKWSRKILLGWELPDEKREDGEPCLIWKRYTSSLHINANLRMDLESWRSKAFNSGELQGFDLRSIVGVPCLLNVKHTEKDGKIYANVAGVMSLPRGQNCPAQHHDSVIFDLDNWDQKVFDTFSDHLKETIMNSKEMRSTTDDEEQRALQEQDREENPEPEYDDDVPF